MVAMRCRTLYVVKILEQRQNLSQDNGPNETQLPTRRTLALQQISFFINTGRLKVERGQPA
jgi:hypothetical protein